MKMMMNIAMKLVIIAIRKKSIGKANIKMCIKILEPPLTNIFNKMKSSNK